jgi:SAM-dependent methyltransferase
LARAVYHAGYRTLLRGRFVWADAFGPKGVPPAELRFRVSESLNPREFVAVGERAAMLVRDILREAGRPLAEGQSVLEFGCGCGRVLAPLARLVPGVHFFGADVDRQGVEWCGANLSGRFLTNSELPPIGYEAAQFDVVYCISVFTHLDDSHTRAWLGELKRILKPGGVLLLTVHGEHVWHSLPEEKQRALLAQGYLFDTTEKLKGIQPDWYQTSYHASGYISSLVAEEFEVLRHTPQGMGYQDVIVALRAS